MGYPAKIYAVTITRIDVVTVYATDEIAAKEQATRFIQNRMAVGIQKARSIALMTHAIEVKA